MRAAAVRAGYACLLLLTPFLLIATAQTLAILHHAFPAGIHDTDSWLRLLLVRDWLSGGSWFDHGIARLDAPLDAQRAVISPWTRPLDLILALLVTLQGGVADTMPQRLLIAAQWVSLVSALILFAGMLAVLSRLRARAWAELAAVPPLLLAPGFLYFFPGNADHHHLMTALMVVALALLLRADQRTATAGWLGALLALYVWISPEGLIMVLIALAWLAYRWLRGAPTALATAMASSLSLTASSALFALAERGADGIWQPYTDTLSIMHVCAFALLSLTVAGLWQLEQRFPALARQPLRKLGMALLLALIAAMLQYAAYPEFFSNAFGEKSAFIRQEVLAQIKEAQPLLRQSLWLQLATLWYPLLAMLAYVSDRRSARQPQEARGWHFLALALVIFLLLSLLVQQRFSYYLAPLAALFLGDAAMRIVARTRGASWRAALCAAAMLILALPRLALWQHEQSLPDSTQREHACSVQMRTLIQDATLTQALGTKPLILYAPTNFTSELLYFTPYRLIAGNYHREQEALRDAWEISLTPDLATVKALLRKRQVAALLLCAPSGLDTQGALARLYDPGHVAPAWLQRLKLPGHANVAADDPIAPQLYRFRP